MKKYIFLLIFLFMLPSVINAQQGWNRWGDEAFMTTYTFTDSMGNDRTVVGFWDFTDDSSRFVHIRTDTISGRPDLNLNPDAWGDVRLFSGAGSIANAVDGRHFIIFRNETGAVDSLEFYIDQYGYSYIISNGNLKIDVNNNIYLDAGTGKVYLQDSGTSTFMINPDAGFDQVLFQVMNATGKQIVIGTEIKDYDHPLLTYPVVYIQGAKGPDSSNQDFVGILHDSSNARFITGQALGVGIKPVMRENGFIFASHDTGAFFITGDGTITKDTTNTEIDSIIATFGDVKKLLTDSIITLRAELQNAISDSLWNRTVPHAYLVAYDSSLTLPATKGVWISMRNVDGTFFNKVELDGGFASTGDSLLLPVDGDFDGHCAINLFGSKDTYEARVLKNSTVLWKESESISANGDTISMNIPFYVWNGTKNDTIKAQIRNISDNDDPTIIGAIMKLFRIH